MAKMGLGQLGNACVKRKFRWMFTIDDVCGNGEDGTSPMLPPLKSARPNLSFKEMEIPHLTETVYRPSRPEWKTINLILYDLVKTENPVIKWFKNIYDASQENNWTALNQQYVKDVKIELYDGCGNVIETWKLENAWPQSIEFGELDMTNSDFLTCDVTLRFDRAFIDKNS